MALRGRCLFTAIMLSILAVSAGSAGAEDRADPVGVFTVVRPARETDRPLQEVMSSAVLVQLTLRKAVVRPADAEAIRGAALDGYLALASGADCQFLLVCEYSTREKELSVSVALYDPASAARVRGGTAAGRIDLSLDEVIGRGMDAALSGITFRQPAAEPVQSQFVTSMQQAVEPPSPAESTAVLPDAQEPSALPGVQEPAFPITTAGRRTRFSLSAGAAPMIATGPAADYSKLGLLAMVSFDMRFGVGGGTLSAGMLSGACMLSASGAASDAFILMVPLGIDIGYSIQGSGPGVTVHLGGGPALMSVTTPHASAMLKIIPYALAGLAINLPLARSLGLAIDASYVLFLESLSLPIMAFAPEVSLYVRF